MIISKSEFAARRGVKPHAISMLISRGRLTAPALTEDGRIDVEAAERQLGSRADTAPPSLPRAPTPTLDDASTRRYREARAVSALIDAEQKRRQLQAQRGMYVRADLLKQERGRAFSELIAAIDGWITELAVELALDADQLATARRSWREFRRRQAETIRDAATALPETLNDAA